MPIEIREVIIKAEVRDAKEPAAVGGEKSAADRENLIRECVGQVLRILEDKKAR